MQKFCFSASCISFNILQDFKNSYMIVHFTDVCGFNEVYDKSDLFH